MNWVPIITTAINAIASIISDKSKSKASKSTDAAIAAPSMDDIMISQGYIWQNGSWVNTRAVFVNEEQKQLSTKAKGSRFGGAALTATEQATLKVYEKQNMNSISNPIAYPDAGFASGTGTYGNPMTIPNIDIFPDAVKKPITAIKEAGMSPLLLLGIVGAGAGILYKANKKPKRGRR